MPVSFSLKNVPDDLAARLKAQAARNHRSIQGELMAILEKAVGRPRLSRDEMLAEIERLGLAPTRNKASRKRRAPTGR